MEDEETTLVDTPSGNGVALDASPVPDETENEAPAKVRIFVVLAHGSEALDTPYSMLTRRLVVRMRDLVNAAIGEAGSPSPDNVEIDLWLDSPGGDADAAYKLVLLFRSLAGRLRVVIPDYAKSAATLVALGADKLYMAPTAELGPLDAQIPYEQGGITISALDIADSLDHLFQTAMTMALSGGAHIIQTTRLSRKETLANVLDFVAKFMQPIVSQLDPSMIHMSANQLHVAREYARRLLTARNADLPSVPEHLVTHYPSHSFVICFEEARDGLGLPVRALDTYEYRDQVNAVFRLYEASGRDMFGAYTLAGLTTLVSDINEEG